MVPHAMCKLNYEFSMAAKARTSWNGIQISPPRRVRLSIMAGGLGARWPVFEPTSPGSRIKGCSSKRAGPRRAPTARTVVWDTAAIPRDERPALPAWGRQRNL
jgi:hypothetical protein